MSLARRCSAIAVLLASGACGAKPTSTSAPASIGEHAGARPPVDTSAIATLPLAVVGLQSLPISMGARTDRLLGAASWQVPCTDAIAKKLTGYYGLILEDSPSALTPELVTGAMTLDEVIACLQAMEGGTRTPAADPGVVALSDRSLLTLPGGALLVTRSADDMHALATARPGTRNPLATIVDPAPASAEWTALAFDYTWELLGVESLGVILEYDELFKAGPLAIRVRFHDVAAAELAREHFDHPDDVVARSLLGESVERALAVIRSRGTITVEGRDVVIRGRIEESEWSSVDGPLAIFSGLAVPVGRPLTVEEQERLLRRRPAQASQPIPVNRRRLLLRRTP